MYEYDKRVVLTLDAGGTNFVFSAIQGNNEMISPIGLPAVSDKHIRIHIPHLSLPWFL